ncbi:MAG: hypothetical protein ACJ770_04800 [Gemmatimonadaceae bacterium]
MKLALMKTGASVIGLAVVFACGGDTSGPCSNALTGSYIATEFVTTGSSGQTNQLLAGSTVNIALLCNGTTTGHLHLVQTASTPAFDADLAGTWTRTGNTVTFSQSADTFIRDMDFTVVETSFGTQLVADDAFAGTRVQITLTRGGEI